MAESGHELRFEFDPWSHTLSQLVHGQPLLLPSSEFDPSRPTLKTVNGPEAIAGFWFGDYHSGPYLATNIYASRQEQGLWLIRVPMVGHGGVTPDRLALEMSSSEGRMPLYLQQTLDAAGRFAVDAANAFLEILPTVLVAVADGRDPTSDAVWNAATFG